MKNTFGKLVTVTVFGESHGPVVGAVLDGLAPGLEVNEAFISHQLSLRRPSGDISTPRVEDDDFVIQSGVFNGRTTGTPISIVIPNKNTHSSDYEEVKVKCRPGHADYTAFCKYAGFSDPRGGGHFSGRVTAGIVSVGAICIDALKKRGISIATHISEIACVKDRDFKNLTEDIELLNKKQFAVLCDASEEKMKSEILRAKADGDSVGGVLETVVYGMPSGVGEPWFDTVEGILAHMLFSIPAVKGVEFGKGFELSKMRGSEANDPFVFDEGIAKTITNNAGGINGGITNGQPLLFKTAIKPTPTIRKEQRTIDIEKMENTTLSAAGRHDPCIVHRARVVVDSVTAIALCDLLAEKYGTDWIRG